MTAETARRFHALEEQAHEITAVFAAHNYEPVAPAIIQSADVFLDVLGESLRARTYVFTDPDGDELCLRPDLTVPTCRLHVERHPSGDVRARYCYNGSAFRFQPGGGDASHPREFRQAGIESFAASDREKAEADIVAHTIEALRAAGLEEFNLRIGDLGLFNALLAAIGMPERWRQRLRNNFWRPQAFKEELYRLTTAPGGAALGLPKELIDAIVPDDQRKTEQVVDAYLARNNIELIGARTLGEMAANLASLAKDARATPLPPQEAELIESYAGVTAPSRAAGARLKDLMRERGIDISDALETFQRRLELLAKAGVEVSRCQFCANFGRSLEYYTGFVFEIESPVLGDGIAVAGGGRYDGLLKAVGAPYDLPAVGAAIHTERLLDAVRGTGT
ncbi:MAG: ATP phosphoribosyltransferase regulatory subunit [Pseudomonadota bacterium]